MGSCYCCQSCTGERFDIDFDKVHIDQEKSEDFDSNQSPYKNDQTSTKETRQRTFFTEPTEPQVEIYEEDNESGDELELEIMRERIMNRAK